jgi:hypothetical protein
MSRTEETKAILLRELNARRAKQLKAPLDAYPEVGCASCVELSTATERLIETAVPYIRTCQKCVLDGYPFRKLCLPLGEAVEWYRSNPTFHRSSDYGIVLTNRALYLFSPFWLMFSRWRRFEISDIRSAEFRDSGVFPALRVQLHKRVVSLRTPWDYADEMKFDRRNLAEAAERISVAAKGESV